MFDVTFLFSLQSFFEVLTISDGIIVVSGLCKQDSLIVKLKKSSFSTASFSVARLEGISYWKKVTETGKKLKAAITKMHVIAEEHFFMFVDMLLRSACRLQLAFVSWLYQLWFITEYAYWVNMTERRPQD